MSTWSGMGGNPIATAAFEFDVTALAQHLAARRALGEAITMTHAFAWLLGSVQREIPELNTIIRFGHLYEKAQTSLLLQVALADGQLAAVHLEEPETLSLSELSRVLRTKIEAARAVAPSTERDASIYPLFILRWTLMVLGFLTCTLNLAPRLFGVANSPFGHLRLNNVGALGCRDIVGIYVPWMRSPGSILLTKSRKESQWDAASGTHVARHLLKVWFAVDHRLVDGSHIQRAWALIESRLATLDFSPLPRRRQG